MKPFAIRSSAFHKAVNKVHNSKIPVPNFRKGFFFIYILYIYIYIYIKRGNECYKSQCAYSQSTFKCD
jgi:hypothetical protein